MRMINIRMCLLIVFLTSCSSEETYNIDLSGEWSFQIDSLDIGEKEEWYNQKLTDKVKLPGSMAENGKGNNITMETKWIGGIQQKEWYSDPAFSPYHNPDSVRFPFWLQPEKKYTGAAWYQKEIIVPAEWNNKIISLKLERCHWETTVWLNDRIIGKLNSLSTPHTYNLPSLSRGKNLLTIRVDNRVKDIDVGENSHSISDHTQSNWNGIVGEISLNKKEKIFIKNLILKPDIKNKSVKITAHIYNELENNKKISLVISAEEINENARSQPSINNQFELRKGINEIHIEYSLGKDAKLWDEFNPNLYKLNIVTKFDEIETKYSETFGLREINIDDNQIKLNGRRIFLRGTLECSIFPKTGYPSTDIKEWKRIYKVIKSFGLNHMRFHSWCPPEAAFEAADEEGIYLQVECGSWANQSTTLGDGKSVDNFVWEESKRIVKEYGNHPSFCFMAYGNEPGGNNYKEYLVDFLTYWKKQDNRRLYTGAAGWPAIPDNEYHNIPDPRIQGWGEQLNSLINGEEPKTNFDWNSRNKMPNDSIPVVSHEIGQWCVYPNFKEIKKYTGVLKPKNFEIFRESIEANHMRNLADNFLMASGKLQSLCYKAEIEASLRTKSLGGFQLLDLHDFPGQGTALVGVLDPFWEEKGYITSSEFSRFCNSVVPLVRLEKRIFTEGETLIVDVEVANFNSEELKSVVPKWKLSTIDGKIENSGSLPKTDISIGNGIKIGIINEELLSTGVPRKLVLEISVSGYTNSWDIWVYPENKNISNNSDILITEKLDSKTISALENGQNVLLSLGKGKVKDGKGGEVGVGFSSIFWNTAWTKGQKPHTLGILCEPKHKALELFPTEYHSNWQWWDAMSHADVIKLTEFPIQLKPIVRVIDDWFTNRSLALLFEVKIEKGKLLVSGIDLHSKLESRTEARQLLKSINHYMNSDSFNPEISLSINEIKSILK